MPDRTLVSICHVDGSSVLAVILLGIIPYVLEGSCLLVIPRQAHHALQAYLFAIDHRRC